MYIQFLMFFLTLRALFYEVSTSDLAGKFFTRQNADENAQSARELASEGHVFVCHVLVTGVTIRIQLASVTGLSLSEKCRPGHDLIIT